MLQKQDLQIFKSILQQLPPHFEVNDVKTTTATSNQQKLKFKREFISKTNLPPQQYELYRSFKDKLVQLEVEIKQKTKDIFKKFILTLKPKYQIGETFLGIEGVEKITFFENQDPKIEDVTFQPENGTVYLIHMWITWSDSCQDQMKKFQEMFEQNKIWEGKVKILGVAIDDDLNQCIENIKPNFYQSIEQFRLKQKWGYTFNEEQSQLLDLFELKEVPFIALINKWGKIVYQGDPSDVNLEQTINEVIVADNDTIKLNVSETQQNCEDLTKEEYKQLKEQIKNLQQALVDASFEGFVSAAITKINLWKQSGEKKVQQRQKIILKYDISKLMEEQLNLILNTYWTTIPQHLRSIKEAKIRDPIEIKTKIQDVFSNLGSTIIYLTKNILQIQYNSKEKKFVQYESKECQVQAKNFSATIYKQGMEKLQLYLNEMQESGYPSIIKIIKEIDVSLRASYLIGEGKQFEKIIDYKKWGTEEFTQIEHIPGQILIIDYWASWYDPSFVIIEQNTKLLMNNSALWNNIVRYVALSESILEGAIEFMNSHEQSQQVIDFYFPKETNQVDILKYDAEYFGNYIIVDKFGYVHKITHKANIKELIDKLIPQTVSQYPTAQQIPFNIKNILQLFLDENFNIQFAQIDPQGVITFNLIIESIQNGEEVIYQQPKLNYWIRDYQQQQFNELLSQLYEIIPETQFKLEAIVQPTFNVEYPGKECVLCKKDISQDKKQYYSPFKKEHVCVECAEFDDQSKTGSARYKYLDTLIFINGPLSDNSLLLNFDSHKLGKNLKLKDDEEGSQSHPIMCNGCSTGGGQGPRYISLNAKPGPCSPGGYIDYCQSCFLVLKDKDSDKAKEIVANDAIEGMISDSLFLRVLFNYGGYQDF